MQSATAELEKKSLASAGGLEETALAELIKARQNLRQMLSESSSSSSCRQVDSQQREKMRPPQQAKEQPKPDQNKQDSKPSKSLQERIEKLAQSQRACASQCSSQAGTSRSQSAPIQSAETQPQSSSVQPPKADSQPLSAQSPGDKRSEMPSEQAKTDTSKSASPSSATRPHEKSDPSGNLVERQQQATEEAADIQQQMRGDRAMTELAMRRMGEAAAKIKDSTHSLRIGQQQQAGQQAAQAAGQLERLSQHVVGLKAKEMADKLTAATSLANQLARQQQQERQAASPDKAERQRSLAEDARTLDDFLQEFQQAARETDAQLADALREAAEANPPNELADQMDQTAQALQSGGRQQAQSSLDQNARRLDALAQQLDAVRRSFVQPHLEQLLAAEKQAAELQQDLQKSEGSPPRSEVERRMEKLEKTLESLGRTDETLSTAATRFADRMQRRQGPAREQMPASGYYEPDEMTQVAVRQAIRDLQVRIQEIILQDAFLDQDEPVPPQYQKHVETYYRVLSEDLDER